MRGRGGDRGGPELKLHVTQKNFIQVVIVTLLKIMETLLYMYGVEVMVWIIQVLHIVVDQI